MIVSVKVVWVWLIFIELVIFLVDVKIKFLSWVVKLLLSFVILIEVLIWLLKVMRVRFFRILLYLIVEVVVILCWVWIVLNWLKLVLIRLKLIFFEIVWFGM